MKNYPQSKVIKLSGDKIQIAEVSIFEPDEMRELVMDLKELESEFSFELVGGTNIENSSALRIYAEDSNLEPTDLLEFAAAVSGNRERAQFIFDVGYRSKELKSHGIDIDWKSLERIKEREREKIQK